MCKTGLISEGEHDKCKLTARGPAQTGDSFSFNHVCTNRLVEVRFALALAESFFMSVPSTAIRNVLFCKFTSNLASGISAQNLPRSLASKNSTSCSIDSNFGNLFSLISLTLPRSHVSRAQN